MLIPAKDEADKIEKCVRSVLAQDYSNFEIDVIDDRSTDGTGQILDDIASKDSRLRVVHLTGDLPPGWGGKSWALHNGLLQANGDWLLFVDADVTLEPDVMSATLGRRRKKIRSHQPPADVHQRDIFRRPAPTARRRRDHRDVRRLVDQL